MAYTKTVFSGHNAEIHWLDRVTKIDEVLNNSLSCFKIIYTLL